MPVKIEFDRAKAARTLAERGLDFARAGEVLWGADCVTAVDLRRDYPEPRFISIGPLDGRLVVIVWTERANAYRVISMRKANDRERIRYESALGGP